ncbi:MAG: acyl-CoA dehydrogenase family protein [Candidatus Thermoplasmatota archaeon]
MDFELSDEQKDLINAARKFVKNEVIPQASKYDKEGEFPIELIKKFYELGFMNLKIPQKYGGIGLSSVDQCLLLEEFGAGCAGIATSAMGNDLGLGPIIIAGTDEQKEKFLRPFTKELKFASFALTEPDAGSDVSAISTTAKKEGNGYILNGNKTFITNASYANLYTVFATIDKSKGAKGLTAFIVPRDSKGISTGKKEDKMGQRASNTASISFEDVYVPEENVLGGLGNGFKVAMATLDYSRPGIAAIGVGVARAALEYSIEYAKKRVQFGRPIAEFQAIKFKLADMAVEIEAARALTLRVAWLLDQGVKTTKESSMAKMFAGDVAMKCAIQAVQIYGGYGYTKEYPVEKLLRDAKLLQIYEGTNEIQRIVISKEILGG